MTEIKLKSPTRQLKERFKALRERLTELKATYPYWGARVLDEFPEQGGTNRLYNVWYGRVADLEITEFTQKIVEEIESELEFRS